MAMNIKDLSRKIGIEDKIISYGNMMAKIDIDSNNDMKGKLVLVTATSPTPYGEGKTTISIGLNDALCKLGYNSIASLREPSLGPVFGLKGGATGGGKASLVPSDLINLHFTGDFHAITSANNLICAAIDNHIHQGNELNFNIDKICFNRCLDVNDRALKDITIVGHDYERKEKFDITAASEIMAILCLCTDINDLRERLDNILIGYSLEDKPIFLRQLKITGSLLVLLNDAIKPNLVQTLEENPVIVHGGPFANIAHGCSSIIATKTALKLADYCVTEAGFGSDLGAIKFFDIKCRKAKIIPDAVVLVTTVRALKYNGNGYLDKGIVNLQAHLDILSKLTNNIIVCLNKFNDDSIEELEYVMKYVNDRNIQCSIASAFTDGSDGCLDLAKKVINLSNGAVYNTLYDIEDKIDIKINKVLKDLLGARNITYSDKALDMLNNIVNNNLDKLPICIAKTQYSISDDKDVLGYPKDYDVIVKDIKLYNGAGFITIYLGNIITMPGLPKVPNYEKIDLVDGNIIGMS